MGRGRRTGRGNRYFRDGGVRKARLKTNCFVPDGCNSRAASTGGNSRNVIVLARSWSPGIRTGNVLPAEPNRLSCIPQTGEPESRNSTVKRSRSHDKIFSNVKTKRL